MLKDDLYFRDGKIPERLLLLAVYDPLMQGQHNKPLGADARSRVPCTIRRVLYNTGWGYPAFVRTMATSTWPQNCSK